jgi:hypothetical protein
VSSRAAALAPAPASRRARPVRARAAGVAAPARTFVERPRRPIAPARPRRVSGPSRDGSARTRGGRHAGVGGALVLAAVGVCEHRVLDRVVRGRVWIGVVTFALLGIVTLQLGLLELNGSIGRVLQRKAQLVRDNSSLSIENSTLASDEHVMAAATSAGMVPVSIQSLRFLDARGASSARAASSLRAPVQKPSSESTGAAGGANEGSSTGEAASGNASTSSSPSPTSESTSPPSESTRSSEVSQPASPASQASETAAAAPASPTGAAESGAAQPPAGSESGGASASGGGG